MTKLAAWLHLPQGESYQRLYAFLPWWLLASVALAGLAAAAWLALRPRVTAAWATGTSRITGRGAGGLVIVSSLIVLACDGAGLANGFFRQDDFSFLQVARESGGVARQLLLIHNDHLCPLYRLEVWVIAGLAGPDASTTALAAWFSACTFLSCVGLLLAGCWVLHELGGTLAALLAFVVFAWMWPGWGEFTAGYYACTAFIQILALGFCATAAMLRGFGQNSVAWLAASLLLATAAAGIDTTGVYVFVSVAVVCLARNWPLAGAALTRRYLFVLTPLFVAVALFYFLMARHAHTPREFVQNPHGTSLSLAVLVDNLRQYPVAVCLTALVAPGGLLLNLVTPTFLQLAVVNDAVSAGVFRGFLAAELLMLVALAVIGPKIWRQLPAGGRLIFAALAANALLSLAMVLAARTGYATNVPVPLWQAKYLMMPTAWVMLALVYVADRRWFSPARAGTRTPALLYGALVAAGWLVASCWFLERTLLPQPMAYVSRGRWGNMDNARERAVQYREVLAALTAIAAQQGGKVAALPEPGAWGGDFYSRYSFLEWGSDYTPRGVTYLFWDLPAAAPALRLYGRWAPPAEFPPESREFITRYAWLAGAFGPPGPDSRVLRAP